MSGSYTDCVGNVYRNLDHPENSSLNGFFSKGKLVGYGRIHFIDDGVFEGVFKDGKRSGQGMMKYIMISDNSSDSASYTGEWRYNLRHGQGEMIWNSDGSRFEGLWHMDQRLKGTFTMGSNSTGSGATSYIGEFRDNLFHGRGKLVLTDGVIYEGVFEQGSCVKFGKLLYKDGSLYFGEMKDFKRNGAGIYLKLSGERIEGQFQNDVPIGVGHVFYPDGNYYIGGIKDYKRDGKGRLYYSSPTDAALDHGSLSDPVYFQGNFQ